MCPTWPRVRIKLSSPLCAIDTDLEVDEPTCNPQDTLLKVTGDHGSNTATASNDEDEDFDNMPDLAPVSDSEDGEYSASCQSEY